MLDGCNLFSFLNIRRPCSVFSRLGQFAAISFPENEASMEFWNYGGVQGALGYLPGVWCVHLDWRVRFAVSVGDERERARARERKGARSFPIGQPL